MINITHLNEVHSPIHWSLKTWRVNLLRSTIVRVRCCALTKLFYHIDQPKLAHESV
jgi:hypothetical protein